MSSVDRNTAERIAAKHAAKSAEAIMTLNSCVHLLVAFGAPVIAIVIGLWGVRA